MTSHPADRAASAPMSTGLAAHYHPAETSTAGSAAPLSPLEGAAQSGPLVIVAPQRASGPDPQLGPGCLATASAAGAGSTPGAGVTGRPRPAPGPDHEETDGQRQEVGEARGRAAGRAGAPGESRGTRGPEGQQGAEQEDSTPARGGSRRAGRGIFAAAMTEAELEENIRDACKKLGILRFHVRISKGTTAGLPDDILIGPRGILWRECKNATYKPTPAQVSTGEALTAAGQDFGLWRPADWYSGRIVRELQGISRIGRAA